MGTTSASGYRDGIWEIGLDSITAHFPEGAWILGASDIESIRLVYGTEEGAPVCDAFIKAKGNLRSDPLGRYPAGKDQLCVELALFAARNRVMLLGLPESVQNADLGKSATQAGGAASAGAREAAASSQFSESQGPVGGALLEIDKPLRQAQTDQTASAASSRYERARRPSHAAAEPPHADYPFQTQEAPPESAHRESASQQGHAFSADNASGQGQGMGADPGYDPGQGYGPGQGENPGQGYGQDPGYGPQQGGMPPSGWERFRSAEWWSWTFNPANPAYRRNMMFSAIGVVLLVGLGVLAARLGVRAAGSFFSGPGFIIFLILLGKSKKRNRRRQ